MFSFTYRILQPIRYYQLAHFGKGLGRALFRCVDLLLHLFHTWYSIKPLLTNVER
jgi:hypothetical protein